MARNEEKAQSLLNRWTTMRAQFSETFAGRRPYLASECTNITEADKWRRELLSEITRKVNQIQNADLGEHAIRDLNDEINKLIGTKRHWEKRMVELGGAGFGSNIPGVRDDDGLTLPGGGVYRYFGAAKNLPGVRELFEEQKQLLKSADKRVRLEELKQINPEYYGYREDDDEQLLELEKQTEKERVQERVQQWKTKQLNDIAEKQALGVVS